LSAASDTPQAPIADDAINILMSVINGGPEPFLPDYAFSVFLAFDAGEYHPDTPHLTSDEVTRRLIEKLIGQNNDHLA